jgi:nucleotidyltransferase/DNA polymerase involved in DNA repair
LSPEITAHTDYSARAREIVERFCPVIIAASIDEHYLDFSGCERNYRRRCNPDDDAKLLRRVREMSSGCRRARASRRASPSRT